MRVVNENFKTITEYDLTAGQLVRIKAIRENAEPIDNVKKFAWADDDYEDVQMFRPFIVQEQEDVPSQEERIADLEEALELLLSGVTE